MRKVGFIVASALLASCSHGGGSSPLPVAFPGSAAQTAQEQPLAGTGYKLLYSFKSGTDAANPFDGLTELNGNFYGTTQGGGGGSNWGDRF